MIYIFSGCQSICSLPGYLCSACGDACKSCPGVCKVCAGACKGVGDEIKHFMERPLCVYVIISIFLSAFTVYSCYGDMAATPGCTSIYLYILMGFAVINAVFAVYVQCKTWNTIMREENLPEFIDGDKPAETIQSQGRGAAAGLLGQAAGRAGGIGGGVGAALGKAAGQAKAPEETFPTNPGKVIIPCKVVQESFGKVFMEDLIVLVMFFGLVVIFVLSFVNPALIDGESSRRLAATDKTLTEAPKAAATGGSKVCKVGDVAKDCGYTFFVLAFVWSCMYMKCSCCANKVSVSKEEMAKKFPEQYGYMDTNAAEE